MRREVEQARRQSLDGHLHGHTIERLVRDGNVATQHLILASTHLDILGRLLLGLDAGTPVV